MTLCDNCNSTHHREKILPCSNCNLNVCHECFLSCSFCKKVICHSCSDDDPLFIQTYMKVSYSRMKIKSVVHRCYRCK